jgi:NAD(P)H-quinone oxidoreductase subunit 5
MVAAHKKFIASRLGDLMLLGGFMILGLHADSFEMDQVFQRLAGAQTLSTSVHLAVVLVAIAAMIKCAQLPLHGWLIQVMEAPTPVSALLHAGVVNLGGFMLIRLAPLINTTSAAQDLLVIVGCTSAVLASLVATTRISIKVHLAWSTCAQMGFMLMECGLGLYGLALLHLLAHSLYKAHEFLGSGSTVSHAEFRSALPQAPTVGTASAVVGACGGLLVAAVSEYLWRSSGSVESSAFFCVAVVGFAIAVVVAAIFRTRGLVESSIFLGSAFLVSLLYFGYDRLFQRLVPFSASDRSPHVAVLAFATVGFVLLYLIQTVIRAHPSARLTTKIYRWFYAGFYVDEIFTRLTFHFWPVKLCKETRPRRDVAQFFESGGTK